jgi:hypothetical protein
MFEFKSVEHMAQTHNHDEAIGMICPYAFSEKGTFSWCRGQKCMKWVRQEDKTYNHGYCGRT